MMCKISTVMTILLCSVATFCFSQQEGKKMNTEKNPIVIIKTNLGLLKIELFSKEAPKTVANFLDYVKSGQYSGTIFHRVIPGFMIQGGGFTPEFTQKPTKAPIAIESDNGLKNTRGTVAMARTSDPNSASSQFFINLVDNGFLDFKSKTPSGYGYTVFGKVIEGMSIVDQIGKVPTGNKGAHQDVPTKPVIIESVIVAAPAEKQA